MNWWQKGLVVAGGGLGLYAGGVWVSLKKQWFTPEDQVAFVWPLAVAVGVLEPIKERLTGRGF